MHIIRKLGYSESLFCISTDEGSDTNNTAMLVRIEGSINPAIFKHAVYQVFLKHPALRSGYVKDSSTQCYYFHDNIEFNDLDIDIFEYDELDIQHGIETMEEAIHKLYKPMGALWRIYLLHSTGDCLEHFIVIGFHHVIIDGVSQLRVVKDLVNFYRAIDQNQSIAQTSYKMTESIADLLEPKLSWQQYINNFHEIYRQYGKAEELKYEKNVLPSETKTKIILCDFNEAELNGIVSLSKQQGIKVTAFMNACLLMAMYRVTGHTETMFQVAADLRKYVKPALSDEIVGSYIQGIRMIMKNLDKYDNLGQLAKDYQNQYDDNFKLLYIPPTDFPTEVMINSTHKIMTWYREGFLVGPAISNWGKVSFQESGGSFKVSMINRATGRQMGDAPFYLHIATINNRTNGAFNYAEPYISQSTMNAIVDEFRRLMIHKTS